MIVLLILGLLGFAHSTWRVLFAICGYKPQVTIDFLHLFVLLNSIFVLVECFQILVILLPNHLRKTRLNHLMLVLEFH